MDLFFYGKSLIPRHYVSSDTVRLSFYTKINKAETKKGLKDIKEELRDRFGELPRETNSFIRLAGVKLLYRKTIIKSIFINRDSILFKISGEDVGKNTINEVLEYENSSIVNKTFKEGRFYLSVEFILAPRVDWFPFLVACKSVFCVS